MFTRAAAKRPTLDDVSPEPNPTRDLASLAMVKDNDPTPTTETGETAVTPAVVRGQATQIAMATRRWNALDLDGDVMMTPVMEHLAAANRHRETLQTRRNDMRDALETSRISFANGEITIDALATCASSTTLSRTAHRACLGR